MNKTEIALLIEERDKYIHRFNILACPIKVPKIRIVRGKLVRRLT